MLSCARQLTGRNLFAVADLDAALAETAVLEVGNLCLRGSQLCLDCLQRLVAGVLDGRDGTANQGRGGVYGGLFVGIDGGSVIIVWRRRASTGRGKGVRNIWGIGVLHCVVSRMTGKLRAKYIRHSRASCWVS